MENESLILDLLEWLCAAPKDYAVVMSVWRTSCPRLTIWEDAVDAGYVSIRGQQVCVTAQGIELLRSRRHRTPQHQTGAG